MKSPRSKFFGVALCLVLAVSLFPRSSVSALAPTGTLLLGQVKITASNGQFISIYNNTNAEIDMSTVQLAYYNYYDLNSSKLTSSRFIPLSGKLASHNYYMVSDGALTICYRMIVNAQSLGFSSTAGTLQIVQNGINNVTDSMAWSKTAVTTPAGIQTLPTSTSGFMQRAWVDGIVKTVNDPWIGVTPSALDVCDLQTVLSASATPGASTPSAAPQKVTATTATTAEATATNIGLVAPEITELLPNPAAPQADDADEFIELYNPNDAVFNLSGYRIEAGTTYSRGYTFKTETLQPKSYTAFLITTTNLQLSNSEGQARLLAPDGTTISETPGYEDAPEGSSWGIVSDSWQWLKSPTPSSANIVQVATDADKTATTAATKTATKKTTGKVAGASTSSAGSGTSGAADLEDATPLHPLVLAGVGLSAVAYALYEYRKDMANRIFQARRYFKNRRAARRAV